ncbi:strictosidine synthase, putative [Ricinus communis]|uniref:Strictosidine synthase, putative n=1 Tax=Ricinus communis TaxID=3988 RepID=B9T2X8_RICCO|nr:strictosidine synthase, putative [Ricinus communis]|eukprot:XP_002532597.1 protein STRICTOSIDINE SYNTHASE-LIKE 2 [Ricinus communis]
MACSRQLLAGAILAVLVSTLFNINFTNFSYKPFNIERLLKDDSELLLPLARAATGPESFAFDGLGRGPYTGISDGRIIRWEEHEQRWIDFAVTSLYRDGCEGPHVDQYQMEHICGRPLGLCFNESNGDLYVADAYMGLLKVGRDGGLATTIATHGDDDIPFNFTNSLDVDPSSSALYFTDSSSRYQRREYIYAILSGDKSGRLLRYDPEDKKVRILLGNLSFPNGVALSKDGNFILIAETTTCRVLKYWIKTSKAGILEVFAQVPGFPDNIKRSPRGGYWVAINSRRDKFLEWVLSHPWIGNSLIKLPFDLMKIYSILGKYRGTGMAVRLDENGDILEVFEDRNRFKTLSEVMEKDGKLWIGSINLPFVGRYDKI